MGTHALEEHLTGLERLAVASTTHPLRGGSRNGLARRGAHEPVKPLLIELVFGIYDLAYLVGADVDALHLTEAQVDLLGGIPL